MSEGFLDCLKHERDITVKPMLSGEKNSVQVNPRLNNNNALYLCHATLLSSVAGYFEKVLPFPFITALSIVRNVYKHM